MGSLWLAVGSALWLGILTSISPCPLATNIAAVSYVGRQVGSARAILLSGALYTAGRTIAYTALGAAAVWSLMSIVAVSGFLQGTFHRLLGPLLIVVGLLLLGVLKLSLPGASFSERLQRRVDRSGVWGAGPRNSGSRSSAIVPSTTGRYTSDTSSRRRASPRERVRARPTAAHRKQSPSSSAVTK